MRCGGIRHVVPLLLVLVPLRLCAAAPAPDDEAAWRGGAALEYTYRHGARGRETQSHAAASLAPDLWLDLGTSGGYIGLTGDLAAAGRGRWGEWDEYAPYLGYGDRLGGDSPFAVDFDLSYSYLFYPRVKGALGDRDSHEAALSLSLPNLLPAGEGVSVTPYAGLYVDRAAAARRRPFDDQGELAVGVSVDWEGEGRRPPLSFSADADYNDGAAAGTRGGWSYATAAVAAALSWGELEIAPSLHYQRCWNDTLDRGSGWWLGLKVSRDLTW